MPSSFVIAAVGSGGKTTALKELARQAALRNQNGSVLLAASTHMYPVLPPESRVFLRDPDEKTLRRELAEPGIVCAGRTAREQKISALMVERGVLGFPKHNLAPSQNTLVGTTAFQLSTSKVADLNSHNLRQASKSSS